MLLLETGMLGAFVALDLFLFYVFWELMLIPMYFIIGIWGGERRLYAAIKFVLYTMVGSAADAGRRSSTSSLRTRPDAGTLDASTSSRSRHAAHRTPSRSGCFAAFALAFAIKVPIFPLHTWLPDAHAEAPTGGSVDPGRRAAQVGRLRLPALRAAAVPARRAAMPSPLIVVLAVIGIVYGALMAYPQPDVKRLVAYSSVSHLGFVMLGLYAFNSTGVDGGVLQMVNHGISTGALFILVGCIYDRRHTRQIARVRRALEHRAGVRRRSSWS